LDFETQDWGIINSDGSRVTEFLKFFNDNIHFEVTLRYKIFELIIASMNDALVEEIVTDEIAQDFTNFIDKAKNEDEYLFESTLDYWISITDEEYPVGQYLVLNE
jgi:hypothetical protein